MLMDATFLSRRRELAIRIRRAFNRGCDDRLRGVPWDANPFRKSPLARKCWDKGWQHVHEEWGKAAKGPYMRLRPVGVAA